MNLYQGKQCLCLNEDLITPLSIPRHVGNGILLLDFANVQTFHNKIIPESDLFSKSIEKQALSI